MAHLQPESYPNLSLKSGTSSTGIRTSFLLERVAHHQLVYPVIVTDRFHVQKLALEALQEIRIKYRWQAIDMENEAIKKAKISKTKYEPIIKSNGDTIKQLLARSRYILYKNKSKWTQNKTPRAKLLFGLYPDIKKAYGLSQQLRGIYNNNNDKHIAMTKLAHWYRNVEESGFKNFNIILNTLTLNYQSILNYFDNRSTNASAEMKFMNSKTKKIKNE
ncbi:Transposase IS204/IS1001/IS1096/IS1165 DDE domain-containing protein [Flavobacterium frigoris]